MPTMARHRRAASLRAALDSVVSQTGVRAVPIVVVNGPECDAALLRDLTCRRDLRLVTLAEADLPVALQIGRSRVDTRCFAELDDDDLLRPGSLAAMLARLDAEPESCAVVGNGIVRNLHGERRHLAQMAKIATDPLSALARVNWLSPGGALFCTERIGPSVFAGLPRYLEWTCLAIRIAALGRISFLDIDGFVHHEDTPDSIWRSSDCTLGLPSALGQLLAHPLPTPLRHTFERRLAGALHAAARECLREGSIAPAWRWHLRSLGERGGFRYLPFTRRLLAAHVLGPVGAR